MRGSFPAPHHHDPNKTLPNFQIWVMVVFRSPITAGERLRDQRFLRAGVRLRYQRLQTLRRPCYRLLRHRSVLGPEFRRDHRASRPSWPLMAEIGHTRGHYSTYRSPGVAGRVHDGWRCWHTLVPSVLQSQSRRLARVQTLQDKAESLMARRDQRSMLSTTLWGKSPFVVQKLSSEHLRTPVL